VSGGATPSASAAATPPPILLAHRWDTVTDLAGWWMSEKLDGVRAYWDGRSFLSRLGNRFVAPAWFVAGLPDVPLDGELWAGRKQFQRTVSIARRQDAGDSWRELTYVVFDAPGVDAAFEQRLGFVRDHVEAHRPPHVRWHPHDRCAGLDHLREELARVEALGGEGLMMRQPGSRYEIGRSWTLRKVKTFHDAEARVIGHDRGAGRHAGRLGALQCELADGTVFHVGTGLSDAERDDPPPVGSIITYRYQELSNDGVPRFPSYVGVRHDVAWPPRSR
jgi:DNA ligase 1